MEEARDIKVIHAILHITMGLDNMMIFCKIECPRGVETVAEDMRMKDTVYMYNPMIIVDKQGTYTLQPLNVLGQPIVAQYTPDVKRVHLPTLEAIKFYETQVRRYEMITKDPALQNALNELMKKVKANDMTPEQAKTIFADLAGNPSDMDDALEDACEMAEKNDPKNKKGSGSGGRTLH